MLSTQLSFAQNTWDGSTNTNWNEPANWSTNTVPTSVDDVVIPNAGTTTNDPDVTVTANFSTLIVEENGILNISDGSNLAGTGGITNEGTTSVGSCEIASDITNNGTFNWSIGVGGFNNGGSANTLNNFATLNINAPNINPSMIEINFVNESTGTTNVGTTFLRLDDPFVNKAGGVVDIPSGKSLSFLGDVTNDGAFTGAGVADFRQANITLSGDGTFVDIVLDLSAVVDITGAQTVSGTLNLSGGKIELSGSGDLTLSPGATITNFSGSHFIATTGTGRLVRTLSGATVFPVGPSVSNYNPVTLNGGTDQFAVRVDPTIDNPPFSPTETVDVEWNIDRLSGSTATDVTLQWNSSQENGSFISTNCAVAQWTGSAYQDYGFGSAVGLGFSNFERTTTSPVTSFSPFIVASGTALPVELLDFKASVQGTQTVLLEWRTATELNNEGFDIERSADARTWTTLEFVPGNGTTQEEQRYTFADKQQLAGLSYYRLKQIDYDGAFEYSPVRSVRMNSGSGVTLAAFPNPTNDQVTVEMQGLKSAATLTISDQLGRRVLTRQLGAAEQTVQLNLRDGRFENGVYLVSVLSRTGITTQQLIINK